MNILIVDDLEINLKLLRELLQAHGFHTLEAANGVEALKILERESISVIISDILMPTMDGYRFCHEVKKNEKFNTIPFIIYSSTYTSESDEKFALSIGADRFLRKPSSLALILKAIQELTGEKTQNTPHTAEPPGELEVMQEYSVRLINKLEAKTSGLERTNLELIKRAADLEEQISLAAFNANVINILVRNDSLQNILRCCAEAFVNSLNVAFARIWTLNKERNELELQASAGLYTHIDGPHSRVPIGKFNIGVLAQELQPHLTNTVTGDPQASDQEWAREESIAGYPLMVEGELVGAIAMFVREPLTDAILQSIGSVANEIALGIKRKQAEEGLRESEERYRTLFDSIDEGFCTIEVLFDGNDKSIDYRFLEVNPSFEKQTGIRDAKGRRMREIAPQHEDHWFEIYGKIALTGEPARFENPAAQLHRWYDVYAFRIGEPQERRVAILFNDITERKRAEEALHKSQDELAHVTRVTTLGELAASIAHEVNQPLAAIVTNGHASLRLLSREAPDLVGAREAVECMVNDGVRASEIIKRIRALLKKTPAEKALFNINESILEVIALANRELSRNQIVLHIKLTDGLPLVLGDRVQFQQVALNLILNANDAMSREGWHPRELIVRSQESERDHVMVSVCDSGTGLDIEHPERIFQPFVSDKPGGLGLGLSISRTIIEELGGRLWATPNEGKGATFRFTVATNSQPLINQSETPS